MFPLKDNLPTDRVPLVTIALIVANVLAYVLADSGELLLLIANAAGLWVFGISVEDSMARWRFVVLYALGAGVAVGLHAALDGAGAALWAGASGGAAAVVAAHLTLYPRAKIVAVAFLILFLGLYEVPAWLLAGVWAAAQVVLALTGAGGAGDDLAAFAWVGGAVAGLAAARLLAQRRKALGGTRATDAGEPRATTTPAVGS